MKREDKRNDIIDLGTASIETKGPTFGVEDNHGGLIPQTGLTDE